MPVVNNVCGVSMGSAERRCCLMKGRRTHVFPKGLLKRVRHFPAVSYASTSGGVRWKPLQATWGMGGILNSSTHTNVHPHNSMFCYSRGCLAQYVYPRPWFKLSCIISLKSPSKEKPDEFTEVTPIWQKPAPYSQTTQNPGAKCAFFFFCIVPWGLN